jgi:exopolyphosphatase/guanosine-5'-triphosphate,3'-diphosphate pyrophosphatase
VEAVLDLGTINCRLLYSVPTPNGNFRVVDSFSRIVRLGEGVGQSGELSAIAMDRAIAALKICAAHIARHKVRRVRAIVTEAARRARNADLFLARAAAETGIALTVVSADDEAALAALGCAPLIGRKYQGALVFDIGGGSTEIIWLSGSAKRARTLYAASVPLGVVNLAEEFGPAAHDHAGFVKMRAAMTARFARIRKAADAAGPFAVDEHHLLGTSGTVTTLAAIALGLPRYNRARVDASWHKTADVLGVVDRLSHMRTAELAAIGSIGRDRADLMLAGCAIFSAICANWPCAELRVADRGLREGMLRELLQEETS